MLALPTARVHLRSRNCSCRVQSLAQRLSPFTHEFAQPQVNVGGCAIRLIGACAGALACCCRRRERCCRAHCAAATSPLSPRHSSRCSLACACVSSRRCCRCCCVGRRPSSRPVCVRRAHRAAAASTLLPRHHSRGSLECATMWKQPPLPPPPCLVLLACRRGFDSRALASACRRVRVACV